MISLNQIVNSNLEMLKDQEASLLKSLDFIQKAIKLFESESESRRTRIVRKNNNSSKKKVRRKKSNQSNRASVKQPRANRLESIMSILKEKKKPISSGELLGELFKQQDGNKDKKHFGTLIYPVLTKAYRSGRLKLKGGKIHLVS